MGNKNVWYAHSGWPQLTKVVDDKVAAGLEKDTPDQVIEGGDGPYKVLFDGDVVYVSGPKLEKSMKLAKFLFEFWEAEPDEDD